MMSTLLILTTGLTDVQLLVGKERQEFDKFCCAALHAELKDNGRWSLTDSNVPKSQNRATALPSDAIRLCTPKLDAVLGYCERAKLKVVRALVLDTRRDPSVASGDPGYAGEVLARRLWEKLNVPVSIGTYLSGAERLEGPPHGDPRDATVRRDVVARIDSTVRQVVKEPGLTRIVLAATGGFPAVKSLVEGVVRLHARSIPVSVLDVPDAVGAGGTRLDRAVARTEVPSPHASFEARRHALELVREGNLIGAWGAVRHLDGDSGEKQWTRVFRWLYLWASSLPLPDDCDLDFLRNGRSAVRAALRVELALTAGDIPAATHGTVAFFEAALWDHLLEGRLVKHRTKPRLFSAKMTPAADLVQDRGQSFEENRRRPFEVDTGVPNGRVPWYRIWDNDAQSIRLADEYLHRPALVALGRAVHHVRFLRNDVVHGAPTPELLTTAQSGMQKRRLWSEENRFLCQPLVVAVLEELGVQAAPTLAHKLVELVESRILAYRSGA
ncbi:MAG: hypothetical protein HYZ53_09490 [Planctomycetes bacterium]|nr:hypothetical protein [Planctomycetota bacterium]